MYRIGTAPGLEGAASPRLRAAKLPTIVRGVLPLEPASGEGRMATGELLDISGRKVTDLHAGANDVRYLAPGVYFVRRIQAQAQAQAVRKVIIAE